MASCCVLISLGSRLNKTHKTHKRFAKVRSTAAVVKELKGLAASSGCSTKRGAATVEDYVFTVLTHFYACSQGHAGTGETLGSTLLSTHTHTDRSGPCLSHSWSWVPKGGPELRYHNKTHGLLCTYFEPWLRHTSL